MLDFNAKLDIVLEHLLVEMVDEETMQRSIDAEWPPPEEEAPRLIFADWLEEQGDWRAEGYRWMGYNHKYPKDYRLRKGIVWGWNDLLPESNHSQLPDEVFSRLPPSINIDFTHVYTIVAASNITREMLRNSLHGNEYAPTQHDLYRVIQSSFKFYQSRQIAEEVVCNAIIPQSTSTYERELTAPYSNFGWGRRTNAVQNRIKPGTLLKAINHWFDEFNGQRWPALEQAFLMRANNYKSPAGDYTRPRMLLFTYLNNLKEPWPEGDQMANDLINAITFRLDNFRRAFPDRAQFELHSIGRYINFSNQEFRDYLGKHAPKLLKRIERSQAASRGTPFA